MPNRKVYFDANIILDIIDSSRKGHLTSKKLWKNLIIDKCTIVISEDILTNIFYIASNKADALQFFKFIQKKWIIIHFGEKVIKNAIDLALEENLDFEDVLQCLCAKENDCNILITNDQKFNDCEIEILSVEKLSRK